MSKNCSTETFASKASLLARACTGTTRSSYPVSSRQSAKPDSLTGKARGSTPQSANKWRSHGYIAPQRSFEIRPSLRSVMCGASVSWRRLYSLESSLSSSVIRYLAAVTKKWMTCWRNLTGRMLETRQKILWPAFWFKGRKTVWVWTRCCSTHGWNWKASGLDRKSSWRTFKMRHGWRYRLFWERTTRKTILLFQHR